LACDSQRAPAAVVKPTWGGSYNGQRALPLCAVGRPRHALAALAVQSALHPVEHCPRRHGGLRGAGVARRRQPALRPSAAGLLRLFRRARSARPRATQARHPAQLPDRRASALHPGAYPPRDAPVLLRVRQGGDALPARQARDRLPARQEGARQAPLRHPVRRLPQRIRVAASLDGSQGRCQGAVPHPHRRARLPAALLRCSTSRP